MRIPEVHNSSSSSINDIGSLGIRRYPRYYYDLDLMTAIPTAKTSTATSKSLYTSNSTAYSAISSGSGSGNSDINIKNSNEHTDTHAYKGPISLSLLPSSSSCQHMDERNIDAGKRMEE